MRRRTELALAASIALIAACGGEMIDTGTKCQIENPNQLWEDYDFDVEVISPAERDCPLGLAAFGQSQFLSADVTVPRFTVAGPLAWVVTDARGGHAGGGSETFGSGGAGRDLANAAGFYFAGSAGDMSTSSRPNQDKLHVEIPLVVIPENSENDVILPYKGGVVAGIAYTLLPRAKKGRWTTVRVMPHNIPLTPAPQIQWYKNGVAFTPPNSPWNMPGMSLTAYSFAPSSTAPIDWKVVISYGFPPTNKTILYRQLVNP